MSRTVNGVVFDLDGTLLDTREVIAGVLRDVLRSFGVIVSFEEMLRRARLSPYRVIREYNISINVNEFRNRYWRFYERNIGYLSAFWGINEVLEALRNRRYRVGVVTALPRTYAERGLEITNLRVEVLVAYHDTRRHRPHPEPVIRAAQVYKILHRRTPSFPVEIFSPYQRYYKVKVELYCPRQISKIASFSSFGRCHIRSTSLSIRFLVSMVRGPR